MTAQPAPLRDDQPVPVCALRNYARLNKQPASQVFLVYPPVLGAVPIGVAVLHKGQKSK